MLPLFFDMIDNPSELELFERIYREYSRLMMKIAFDIVHDVGMAEDAVQESFIKIAKNMKYFYELSPKSRNLAVIIARNAAIEIYNTRKRIVSGEILTDEISDENIMQHSDSAEETALRYFEVEQVKVAIAKLQPIYRDAVTLRFLNEMSYREIADILNISEDSAKKRVKRALMKLREQLE